MNNEVESEIKADEGVNGFSTLGGMYREVHLFNSLAGGLAPVNSKEEFLKRVYNQALRVAEEANEVLAACDAGDMVGILDGVGDVAVTYMGLDQIVVPYMNTVEACNRICENNLLKFFDDKQEALIHSLAYAEEGIVCRVEEVEYKPVEGDSTIIYCIRRNSDNKLMKPKNHPKVDLTDLVIDESYWESLGGGLND